MESLYIEQIKGPNGLERIFLDLSSAEGQELSRVLSTVYQYRHAGTPVKKILSSFLWKRIAQSRDTLQNRTKLVKCFSALARDATLEVANYLVEALNSAGSREEAISAFGADAHQQGLCTNAEHQKTGKSENTACSTEHFLWIGQVLDTVLELSQKEASCELFRNEKTFKAIQKNIKNFPSKVFVLLTRLISKSTYLLIEQETVTEMHRTSTGTLRTKIEVLQAYIEGYTLQNTPSTAEDPFEKKVVPWDKKKHGAVSLLSPSTHSLVDALISKKKETLALSAAGFLSESSPEVLNYIEESGHLQKIVKEASLTPNVEERLKFEHFLSVLLSLQGRSPFLAADEGYIECVLRNISEKLDVEVVDGEVHSGIVLLKLLSRKSKIVSMYMCSNQMISTVEKILTVTKKTYTKEQHPEREEVIKQCFSLVSNLVLYNSEWKEIGLEHVLPHATSYIQEKTSSLHVLKFVKSILYECSEEISAKIFAKTAWLFSFRTRKRTPEEKLEYCRILRNLTCKHQIAQLKEVVRLVVSEFYIAAENVIRGKKREKIPESDLSLLSELLQALSNIAVLSPECVTSENMIRSVVDICSVSPILTNNLVWYLTNILWSSPDTSKFLKEFRIQEVLLKRLGADKDTDERISQLIRMLS